MNCREFLIEFEERGVLSKPAVFHLTICADCRQMSERQTQIWLMIDRLPPVAAPSDFDFHVKARIAQKKPSDFQTPRFLPILRYVLPLSIVVLLFGFFAYNSASFFSNSSNALQTAQAEKQNANAILSVNASPTNQIELASSGDDKIVVTPKTNDEKLLVAGTQSPNISKTESRVPVKNSGFSSNKSVKLPRVIIENSSSGGSRDIASKNSIVRVPKEFNSTSNAANAPKIETPKSVNDSETLSIIGIKFVSENGKRKVEAVQENSIADRSGVKVGDIIEKIDGNSLTVIRGTERLEISLRNDVNRQP